MQTKTIQLSPEELRERFEARGLSIHGIPLLISSIYKYEKKEIDDGLLIFHYYQPFGYLHRNSQGRQRYLCHPEKRTDLESDLRKN
jgi:hypothetical protein